MPFHMMKPHALDLIRRGRKDYADVERYCADPKAFLALLDQLGIERAGLINYVAPDIIGFTPEVNDWSANYCKAAPDRLIAFGSVLPSTVSDPGAEVDRIAKLGIRALKLHPSHQVLSPNGYIKGDRGLAAVYERAQANGLPIMIHTGTSIFPGARNLHAQPMLCDDVCIDYPDLVVILAHGGRPLWMNEAFFLVRRHKNMYMDISLASKRSRTRYCGARTGPDRAYRRSKAMWISSSRFRSLRRPSVRSCTTPQRNSSRASRYFPPDPTYLTRGLDIGTF